MKAYYLIVMILLPTLGIAKSNLGAHVHGMAHLDLAIDGKNLYLELKVPGESLLGFEHKPKSKSEKKKFESLKSSWKSSFPRFYALSKAQCQLKDTHFELAMEEHDEHEKHHDGDHEAEHAEIKAITEVKCSERIQSDELKISLSKNFKGIKNLKVTGLFPGKQISMESKEKVLTIKIP